MNIFVKFYAFLQYRDAVIRADKAHEETGRRYFVLPNASGKVNLVITDRKNFRLLKMKHYIGGRFTVNDALQRCFYYTPTANGANAIDEDTRSLKLSQYYKWYDRRRKRK